jgi:hypothetical protein
MISVPLSMTGGITANAALGVEGNPLSILSYSEPSSFQCVLGIVIILFAFTEIVLLVLPVTWMAGNKKEIEEEEEDDD